MIKEMRHITDDDYLKIINICEHILRGGDFDKLRNELLMLYRQIIELRPYIVIPPSGIFNHKKKSELEINKSRKEILIKIIKAAKSKNYRRLVYLFSNLK